MSDLLDLYQELIIDHGRKPRHYHKPAHYHFEKQGFNPFCGDNIHLYGSITNNTIDQISFQGEGCAISMASTSLMLSQLQGMTISRAQQFIKEFYNLLLANQHLTESSQEFLGKLVILQGVKKYPARVKCATLAWHTLEGFIREAGYV
jgi:nitrogen fixation NifU-like protein